MQYLRPISDITTTNWIGSYADIDEVSASDSDFGYSTDKTNVTYETKLGGTITDPAVGTGHIVRCRVSGVENGTPNSSGAEMGIYLYQSGTLIATIRASSTVSAWENVVYNLTENQANNITDYSDLRLRFVVSRVNKKAGAVSWVEMEIPDVSAIDESGYIKVWNGSIWEWKPIKVWSGSAWIKKPLKYWNGSAWIKTNI